MKVGMKFNSCCSINMDRYFHIWSKDYSIGNFSLKALGIGFVWCWMNNFNLLQNKSHSQTHAKTPHLHGHLRHRRVS
uniref:Uncharacterized protein n=1 Tax=Candidatus Kentrum sp. TC TaxID=2126339 RepID=A0A450ZGP5_9GAMM|nr:MAG: hypothetical protein BECKTC1821D_GA0114238_12264 [Candidatus Kentron sp. TC]